MHIDGQMKLNSIAGFGDQQRVAILAGEARLLDLDVPEGTSNKRPQWFTVAELRPKYQAIAERQAEEFRRAAAGAEQEQREELGLNEIDDA